MSNKRRPSKKVSPRRKNPNTYPPLSDPRNNNGAVEQDNENENPAMQKSSSLNKKPPRKSAKQSTKKQSTKHRRTRERKTETTARSVADKARAQLLDKSKDIEDSESIFQPEGGESAESIMKKLELPDSDPLSVKSEYTSFSTTKESTSTIAFDEAPGEKNRYLDVPCLDNTRVPLRQSRDGNDYIHANYVDGYKHSKAYICCQGPKEETAEDFWHMIWQEETFVIAMLTQCTENELEKCSQYWPCIPKKSKTFGLYTIHAKNKIIHTNYEYTELLLTRNDRSEERSLVHALYTSWPDNGIPIPDEVTKFILFLDIIRKIQKSFMEKYNIVRRVPWTGHTLGPPMVIHCSAGIGRTGTFCAIDICCRNLLDTERADVAETVRLIRSQRARAVQRIEQYLFVYFAIICFAKIIGIIIDNKETE